jgi:ribosome-associated protein
MSDTDTEFDAPSKTALKREMTERQALGEALSELSPDQLQRLGVDDPALLEAFDELRRIRSNSARRRHRQYIGKLMRDIDIEAITAGLTAMKNAQRRRNDTFHQLEQWRDSLLQDGPQAIERFLVEHPHADRQHLRQLVRQHQREQQAGKPPAASRKLFRYLRELDA